MLTEWWESRDGKQRFLTEEEARKACGQKVSQKVGKMSKQLRNYQAPKEIFDTHGADATVISTTMAVDEMTQTYLAPMVDFTGGDYFVVKPCDSKVMLNLIDELAGVDEQPPEPVRSGFPTRAVWPTARAITLVTCG